MDAVLATGRYPAPTRKEGRKKERGRECSDVVVVVVVAVPSSSSSPELRGLGAILVAFLEKLLFVLRCFGFLVSVPLEAVFAAVESFFFFYVSSHYQCMSPCLRFICCFQHRFFVCLVESFFFPVVLYLFLRFSSASYSVYH
jgi:hypothetical protein